MTRTITSTRAPSRRLISDWSVKLFLAGVVLFFVAYFAFLGLYTETSIRRGFSAFDGAVEVDIYLRSPGFFRTGTNKQGVRFILRRTGEYRSFPKDSYEVKIAVLYAASSPQSLILVAGDEDTERLVDLQFQWADGSRAQKEQWVPHWARIELTRKSDGERTAKELHLITWGDGGGSFPPPR